MINQADSIKDTSGVPFEWFDADIKDPLNGYRSTLREGTVPEYIQNPQINAPELIDVFGLDHREFEQKVRNDSFQQGILVERPSSMPPEYATFVIRPKLYLTAHQDAARTRDKNSAYRQADFKFRATANNEQGGIQYVTPNQIAEPLRKLMATDEWHSRVTSIQGSFDGWHLRYHIGDLGAISGVSAVAKFSDAEIAPSQSTSR